MIDPIMQHHLTMSLHEERVARLRQDWGRRRPSTLRPILRWTGRRLIALGHAMQGREQVAAQPMRRVATEN